MIDNPNTSVPINLRVRPETREKLIQIATETYRGMGDTFDWLVADAWNRMEKEKQEKMTIGEVVGS